MTTIEKLPASESNAVALSSQTPDSRPLDAGISNHAFPLFIYTLSDPNTLEVRYVGITIDLRRRFLAHLWEKNNPEKLKWIESLIAQGKQPTLKMVEEISPQNEEEAFKIEKKWILHYSSQGCNLLNKQLYKPKKGPKIKGSKGSKIFFCRVTEEEETKFKSLLHSEGAGCSNMGEFTRLLYHREYNRRHNLPKPKASDWQTTLRPKPGRKPQNIQTI